MRSVVLDTSALIRLYVPDGPLPDGLEESLQASWRVETTLFIPELGLVETAQVLWKKESAGYLTKSDTDEIMSRILELPLEIVGHYDLLLDALSIARLCQLTVYDSLFISLAQKHHSELITADQRLKKAFDEYSKTG